MLKILHLVHVTKDPELKVMATCQLAGGLTASVGELPANSQTFRIGESSRNSTIDRLG